jgi:predicted nucleic acid-binding protein
MTPRYVLDACALLALLRDEPGADIVADVINAANAGDADISMHKANLLEVYYDIYRSISKEKADEVMNEIKGCPITVISEISDIIFEEAGRFKASYKVSFADTFAIATASVMNAALLTADRHEMDEVEKTEQGIKFQWVR